MFTYLLTDSDGRTERVGVYREEFHDEVPLEGRVQLVNHLQQAGMSKFPDQRKLRPQSHFLLAADRVFADDLQSELATLLRPDTSRLTPACSFCFDFVERKDEISRKKHRFDILAKNGSNVEATFDFVEKIVQFVAFGNVASTLLLMWTGFNIAYYNTGRV